ncbi:hypothetical protein BGZ94_006000 [Podila epigama]|nr:hypothetical protein BGZ94_006000 [Podila epigama]
MPPQFILPHHLTRQSPSTKRNQKSTSSQRLILPPPPARNTQVQGHGQVTPRQHQPNISTRTDALQHEPESHLNPRKRKAIDDQSHGTHDSTLLSRRSSLQIPPPEKASQQTRSTTPSTHQRLVSASAVAKMLAPAVKSAIQHSHQPLQRHSAPRHSATIPRLAQKPLPKKRWISEVARFIVPPSTSIVRGGYAERLLQMMHDQKSEHAIWLTLIARPNLSLPVFDATEPIEPLVTVEIVQVRRDHRLQWARCKVIHSSSNRAPFKFSPPSTHSSSGRHRMSEAKEFNLSKQTDQGNVCMRDSDFNRDHQETITPLSENDCEEIVSLEANDSISGLHRHLGNMVVLESSKGSIYSGTPLVTQGNIFQDRSFLRTTQEDEEEQRRLSPRYHNLKSSQGSVDGDSENAVELCDPRGVLMPTDPTSKLNHAMTHEEGRARDGSIKKANSQISIIDIGFDDENEGEDEVSALKTSSAISSISDLSSIDNDTVPEPIEDDEKDSSLPKHTREATSPQIQVHDSSNSISNEDTSLPAWFVKIIFSNLQSWTDLKIHDKVEIHDPCLTVHLPATSRHKSSQVFIVERYCVL